MGWPAVTTPSTGIFFTPVGWFFRVMDRVRPSPLSKNPPSCKIFKWEWTVEGDRSPTAWQISRTAGG